MTWQPGPEAMAGTGLEPHRGELLTPETIRSMRSDPLHRDRYTEAQRLDAWETVNRYHMWDKKHNPGLPPANGIYLFSADMGEGKSHLMLALALLAWMFRAVPVYSSESVGALFGYRLPLAKIYNFADVVEPGSILLVDELAALADAYSGRANRGRTLHNGLTSFRKGENLALTATAAEAHISWQLRIAMKAVIEPRRKMPTKDAVVRYDYAGRPQTKKYYVREHELTYPKFCYLEATAVKSPWIGRWVPEDYRAELAKARTGGNGQQAVDPRWKKESVVVPVPYYMDLAANLYDTFMRVPVSDAFEIGADEMRAETGGRSSQGRLRPLVKALATILEKDVFVQYRRKRSTKARPMGLVPIADLQNAVERLGHGLGTMDRDAFVTLLRECLGEEKVKQRSVKLEDIDETLRRMIRHA